MEMECCTIGGSIVQQWTVETNSVKGKQKIFLNQELAQENAQLSLDILRFGVNADLNGFCVLYLNATTLDDAGVYTWGLHFKTRIGLCTIVGSWLY